MKCPYCENEMRTGILYGDGRSGLYWNEGDKKIPFLDAISGKGRLSSARFTLTNFTLESQYCDHCKKLIIDTEIAK